ncbi:TetR/AcrR family transcriptional regulator [Streptomyces armeniacus]|uniref:TetR/AcrR family transcriptional regulator n=1 Tax=Streptomyces armeniacus TaxID=83291 RepID=A0A345XYR4_9ACTN|nr:TetR/AcrR family transcriptional regulator [Streptomyces armeniacus]AXK36780.1 TetR/AcrR family transcriptional regulator [Streptomyces armeniacus]
MSRLSGQGKGPGPADGSRVRLIRAASRLMARQGYEATVVKDIAREGAAPMGSFYYHFPGGKEQLGAAALRQGGAEVGELFAQAMAPHGQPAEAAAACATVLADRLAAASWRDGCPVATTALETIGRSDALQQAAAEAFDGWQRVIAEHLRRTGLPDRTADELAVSVLAMIEGAEMIARVQASRTPLDAAAAALRTLVGAASPSGD